MSTKQQTKNPNQAEKKPKEAPQHAKNMHELTQPKAKIIQITKEDQKKIANVKRILQELNFEGAMWPDEDIYTVLKERVNHYSEAEIYQAAALHIMEAREQPEQWQEVGGKAKKAKKAEADNKNRPRNPSDANRSPNTASGEFKPRSRPQQRDGQQTRQKKTEGGDHAVAKGQEHVAGAQNEQTQQTQQHQRQQSQQQRGRGPRAGQQHQQQPQQTNGVAPSTSTPANGTISWANKVKGEPKPQPPQQQQQQQPQQTQEKPAYKQKETTQHATHGNPPSHPAQQHRTAPAVTKAQQQASQTTQANTASPVREVSEIESNVSKLTINPATVNLPPLTSASAPSSVPSFGRVQPQDNGPRINLPGTGLEQPPGLKVHFGQSFETEKPAKTETKPEPLPVVAQTPTLPQATPVVPAAQAPQTAAKPQTPAEGAMPTMMPNQFPGALFPFQYPMSLMNPQMFYDPSQLASAPTQTNAGREQQDASATQQSTAGQPGVAPYQYGTADAAAWANSLNTGAYPYHMQQLVNQQGYVAYQTQPNSQFYPPYGRPGPYQKGPYWNMNYGGAYPQPYSGTGTEDQDYMKHSLSGQGYPQQHTTHTNPTQNRFFNNASGTTGTTGQGMMDNKQQGVQQGQQGQAVGQQGQPSHAYGAEHEFPYPGYHQFQNYSSFVQPGMQVPQQLPYQQQQRTNPNYQQ
jgi:hypothetical protein